MREIEEIKKNIDINAENILLTRLECEKSSKATSKFVLGAIAFGVSSLLIITRLNDVLNDSSLVLACIPTIAGMISTGALGVISNNKTNHYYSILHDLDVERFDLKLELELSKKNVIRQAIETKDFSNLDEEFTKEVSKEDLEELSKALTSENELSTSDDISDIHYHKPKSLHK